MFDIFYLKENGPVNVFNAKPAESIEHARQMCKTRYFWIVNYLCDYSEWDFLWEPAPWESNFRHAFASQHQKDSGTYLISKHGYDGTKYNDKVIPRLVDTSFWDNTNYDFDYTWHPDPTEPPYIYQFGTQHQKTGGPRYVVPDATEVKYVDSLCVNKTTIDQFWDDTNYDFDYTWHPDDTEPPYIYHFGTQWQKTGGPRYIVPGATEVKYVDSPRVVKTSIDDCWDNRNYDFDYTWHPDSTDAPYIYQFGTQWQKTGGPRYITPGATNVKYVNSPRITKTNVDNCWEKPNGEFADFDYTWHPDSTDRPYIYQFATQHQKTGGPRYVVQGATEVKYIDEIKIKTHRVATGIVIIKHTNSIPDIDTDIPIVETARFISSYLGTLIRVLSKVEDHEHVWIISDLCDYTNFDFSWHPEIWQNTMLHVFPSNEQKFGDTFFVHIPSFLERAREIEVLEWFNPLNFVQEKPVVRKDPPAVEYTSDSVVDAVWHHTFVDPAVQFYRYTPEKPVTISLWQERLRTVVPLRKGGESVIVPRDAKNHIQNQVYDYQWINKKHKPTNSKPVDIVFISNGESNAEQNWEHLCKCTQNIPNRVVRVDNVKGRAEAYRAAVSASETDWAFCVFAKLEVNPNFDWSWQPDRLQAPKHYIFHAENPVNGLTYGHMAMIAYNKQLTLNTNPTGLDFTLDSEHEVVPLLSGIARYADDPWVAWRSAFRECIKLYHSLPNIENEWRLHQWLKTNLQGDSIGDWSIRGAEDAIDYYDSVQGSFDALRLTYEWAWLEEYFTHRYNQSPNRLCTQFLNQSTQDR